MATAKTAENKDAVFEWEGKDRNGKQVRGEMRAAGENQVKASLRRQGVTPDQDQKTAHERRQVDQAQGHGDISRASWPR
jgi:type II secretory pathway component PulF